MTTTLVLPVAPIVSSSFVVAAPKRFPSRIHDLVDAWFRRSSWPPPGPGEPSDWAVSFDYIGPDLIRSRHEVWEWAGNAPEVVDRVVRADRHLVVRVAGWPGWPARPAVVSWGLASTLAVACDGLVLDPMVGSIAEPTDAACDLTGPPYIPVASWVAFHHGDDGEVSTLGLKRFGVPELVTDAVPAELRSDWTWVLAGLGTSLLAGLWTSLREEPALAFVEVPNPHCLHSDHVYLQPGCGFADALLDHDRLHLPIHLRRDVDPAGLSRIVVGPPADFRGTHEQWLRSVVDELRRPPRTGWSIAS